MHVAIATVFALYAFKKGKHRIVKKNKKQDWNMEKWTCCSWVFIFLCTYLCLLKKQPRYFNHLNPCRKNEDWHISYLLIWKCVHAVSYVIHTVTSLTCCFWQLSCRCEAFFSLSFISLVEDTVHANMASFSLTQPVLIVHPVNLISFYLVFCVSSFMDLFVNFPRDSEAVAKCVSFNPTGAHRSLVYTPPVHMYILYMWTCKYLWYLWLHLKWTYVHCTVVI